MSRKAKGKGFKMKGHALPGINQRSETPSMKDGRSASSPFQQGFGPQPVGEEPIDQRSSGISIDRDEGLTIQEKIERRIREKQAAEERDRGKGLESIPDKTPMKNYRDPQDYKVFNMGNEPTPMKQSVTIPGEDVEGNPAEYVGSYKETKGKIKDMSRRERRRAVAKEIEAMKEGQDYYWDPTIGMKKPIPGRFSSKAAKEDFILKQSMKYRDKGGINQDAMTHEEYKAFEDAGIDPTTMGNSPINQLVDRLPSEIEDLEPYTGDNVVEQINDLEDRIGFINENESTYGRDLNEQEKKDLTVLNTELQKLRNDQRMEDALKRDEELGPNPDEVD